MVVVIELPAYDEVLVNIIDAFLSNNINGILKRETVFISCVPTVISCVSTFISCASPFLFSAHSKHFLSFHPSSAEL